MPQILFGALSAKGRLPVTISETLKAGTGLPTPDLRRLRYGTPEEAGLDSRTLAQIDNIALESVAYAAAPGCQVLVAKDGWWCLTKATAIAPMINRSPSIAARFTTWPR
ncbi:hypothetical protein [Hymenobacter sp. AT01-02]|uniref:hypothetical protein n=1 Tax=Hymenobacter sp. AT01-02 TaxID=1571877 RepID=UPI001F3EFC8D|nr:hypothetical protein [Hymenobacter sp. AT01-02]